VLDAENSAGYGNHRSAGFPGRLNIRRGVANETSAGPVSEFLRHIADGVAKDSTASFAAIAKTAKAKKVVQLGRSNFAPANTLQVSRGNAQQFSGIAKPFQQLDHAGTNHGLDLPVTGLNLAPNYRQRPKKASLKFAIRNSHSVKGDAQDGKVGLSVILDAFDIGVDLVDLKHGLMQRVPVDEILGYKQRAINVKNVGVHAGQLERLGQCF